MEQTDTRMMSRGATTRLPFQSGKWQRWACKGCDREAWLQLPLTQPKCQACGGENEVKETADAPPDGAE